MPILQIKILLKYFFLNVGSEFSQIFSKQRKHTDAMNSTAILSTGTVESETVQKECARKKFLATTKKVPLAHFFTSLIHN